MVLTYFHTINLAQCTHLNIIPILQICMVYAIYHTKQFSDKQEQVEKAGKVQKTNAIIQK